MALKLGERERERLLMFDKVNTIKKQGRKVPEIYEPTRVLERKANNAKRKLYRFTVRKEGATRESIVFKMSSVCRITGFSRERLCELFSEFGDEIYQDGWFVKREGR